MDEHDEIQVITFGEFIERWNGTGSMLIAPKDWETRDKEQLGVVVNRYFKKLKYLEKALTQRASPNLI